MCVCVLLQTSGDSSLTTIISDLQSAQPAKAQGHLWTQTFSSFSLHYSILSLCPLILTCHSHSSFHAAPFSPFILSVTSLCISATSPPPPQPKACPPLTLCLLSVNSFFLFPVCWPRLTYFSLSLLQLSLSLPRSVSLLLSLWFLSIFPPLSLGKRKIACICVHTNTHIRYTVLCMHIQKDMRAHARKQGHNRGCELLFPRQHTHTALLMLS